MSVPSDLDRIIAAFAAMNTGTLIALCNVGYTQSEARAAALEVEGDRGGDGDGYSAIYWHEQSHEAFDAAGNLTSGLSLHWYGDRERLASALRPHCTGFDLEVPSSDDVAFRLLPEQVSPADVDPRDALVTWRFLDQLSRDQTGASHTPETRAVLRGILANGTARCMILAFRMLGSLAQADDVAIVLGRLGEVVGVEEEMRISPHETVGYLLDAMVRLGEPTYASCLLRWAEHENATYRAGVARHGGTGSEVLSKLVLDDDLATRSNALWSLMGKPTGPRTLLELGETDASTVHRKAIVKALNRAREWHPEVKEMLADPACAARFDELARGVA